LSYYNNLSSFGDEGECIPDSGTATRSEPARQLISNDPHLPK